MKLILQSIKSMFRKMEVLIKNESEHLARNLANVRSLANSAKNKANDAYNYADVAHSRAVEAHELANQPSQIIVDAKYTGEDGKYKATIDDFTIKPGIVITVIPNQTCPNDEYAYLSINDGGYKEIRIYSLMDIANPTQKWNTTINMKYSPRYFTRNRPVTLQYDGQYWIVTNVHFISEEERSTFTSICISKAQTPTESINLHNEILTNGCIFCIALTNGWEQSPPKIKVNNVEYDVVDADMNVIQSISIKPGGLILLLYFTNIGFRII